MTAIKRSNIDSALTAPLYGPAEIARLVGMPASRAARWLRGRTGPDGVRAVPATRTRSRGVDPRASFLDLIELRLAWAIAQSGRPLHQVRRALDRARELYGEDYPFATRRLLVSPSGAYVADPRSMQGAPILQDLFSNGQTGFGPVVEVVSRQFTFAGGVVTKWYPMTEAVPVVVDPHVQYGRAVIAGTRISTAVIAELVDAEHGNVARVAAAYEIPVESVKAAWRFESRAGRAA